MQTALIEWMPPLEDQETVVSIYRTHSGIELRSGCDQRSNARLICTHRSYDDAYEFAELLAQETGLPLHDLVSDRPC
ncbi:MAG: hypothetical protein FWK01_30880 [Pantanalinema sp. GBBB05]|nr:hypothetical protein [Pantanalinema sp. GBBB05]